MFLVLLVSLIPLPSDWSNLKPSAPLTFVNSRLPNVYNVDKRVNKVNEKSLSLIDTCVNKVNAAFTTYTPQPQKVGGVVS